MTDPDASSAPDRPDPMFTEPYVDSDEWREEPTPHRYVHGGFRGTQTRFSFYFPPTTDYQDRYLTVIEGGQAGHEDRAAKLAQQALPSMAWAFSAGGYLVESNGGHIVTGPIAYTRGSPDPSVTAYRATAAATRYAREYAEKVYGRRPRYGYILGGSGGGRALLGLENTSGVWDGAVQFINAAGHGVSLPEVVARAVHVLGSDLAGVVASSEPGGDRDPFAGPSALQREVLATLYRSGFQQGGEFQLQQPGPEFGVMRILFALAAAQDPRYFEDFWLVRGYAGTDGLLGSELVEQDCAVAEVVTAAGLTDAELLELDAMVWRTGAPTPATALGLAVSDAPSRSRGADILVKTGDATGRRLTCIGVLGDRLLVDFANGDRLDGIGPGDRVWVTNRRFLAYYCSYLHQVDSSSAGSAQFMAAGRPLYPQRGLSLQDVLVGVRMTADYSGKLIYVGSVQDSMSNPLGWPVTYAGQVRAELGADTEHRLRVWLNENATHIQASERPRTSPPVATTRLVDWIGSVEQAVLDLIAWVENDVPPPPSTHFECTDGQITLPADARVRGGLQPVVQATVNGLEATVIPAGESVRLHVHAEAPPDAGRIVSIEWDIDGTGTWPYRAPDIDGASTVSDWSVTQTFHEPGTYFPAVRVTVHRDGELPPTHGAVPNLGRVRVDVR